MAVSDIRERWRTSLIEGTTDWAVEHQHVADVLGRLIWGTDTGAFYREIARLPEPLTGTKVPRHRVHRYASTTNLAACSCAIT